MSQPWSRARLGIQGHPKDCLGVSQTHQRLLERESGLSGGSGAVQVCHLWLTRLYRPAFSPRPDRSN
jgi:hypothetical protein